jgi:hypothetical protein
VSHLALCRFGAVFDFCQQLRFDLNPFVRDLLRVRLRLRISGVKRLRRLAADVLSKPWSTLPA